jgi:hypothetical protein
MLKQDRLKLAMAYRIAAQQLENDDLQGTINSFSLFAQHTEKRGDFISVEVFEHVIELLNEQREPENPQLEVL